MFAELVVKYGPIVVIAWFVWIGYRREERQEKTSLENTRAIQLIAISATKAITEITSEVRNLRADMEKKGLINAVSERPVGESQG